MKVLLLALALTAHADEKLRERMAGAVVRSDEWRIDRAAGLEEFLGRVSYKNAGQSFESDWARWDRRKNVFHTRGRTHATRRTADGETLEAWGHEGEYEFATDRGRALSGAEPVRFRRTPAVGAPLDGIGQVASWDGPADTMTIERDVRLWGSSETARGELAVWHLSDRSLTLTGGPPVLDYRGERYEGALQAEKVELLPDQGLVRAKGGVRGWAVQTSSAAPAGGAP